MFGWFKKQPNQADLERELKAIHDRCIAIFTGTWRESKPKATTAEELAQEMEIFSVSAVRFIYTNYPVMKDAPPFLLWLIVFTSVLESKTHPTPLVNKAIDLLRARHAS